MTYTIAQGDTLSGIASKNNTTVQNLMALNPYIKDANKIYAGASLNLPSVSASKNSTGVVSAMGATNTNPAQVPQVLKPTDYSGLVTNGTATLGANDTSANSISSANSSLPDYYKQYLDNLPKPISTGDIYSKDYTSSGIDQKTIDFNTAKSEFDAINAQIAGINAEAQSAKLAREQVGNAPGFVTSAEQAQIDRALAIRTLPLQVQALAAQAKMNNSQAILQQAQDHLDRVFQIHIADATAQYNYQTNLVKSVFDYATEQQKALLTAKQKEADQAFTTRQNILNNAQSLAKSALDSGQSSLAGKILALDPYSSSYQTEVASLAGQIKPKLSSSINSNQTIDNERALFNQFNGEPIVKDYNTILAKKQSVDSIIESKLGGPGDLAIVYEFMKGLDPTSVVRETEYASAAKSGNIFAGAFSKFNGYLKPNGGFLPDSVKSSFQSIVDSKLKVQQKLYDNVKKQYEDIALRQRLNPKNVVIDYGVANKKTYTPGSTIHNNGILYLVGIDGESITPIGNYAGI